MTKCVESSGAKDKQGYVHVNRRRFGKRVNLAHVLSWVDSHGRLPKTGFEICHSCGNSSCIEPKHLYEGTRSQNIHDQVRHGRHITQTHPELFIGSNNGASKLSESKITVIRERLKNGEKGAWLAKEFSVSDATISLIKHGKRWTCV